MSAPRSEHDEPARLAADLVEYLVVEVPDLDALASLVPALTRLVETATIRILDLVAIEQGPDGTAVALGLVAVDGLTALVDVDAEVGGMLSEHDIALASLALRPGTAGIVLVTEDRWAEPLSVAARRVGGQILGGERIPSARVGTARGHRPDLLARPLWGVRAHEDGVTAFLIDPVGQLEELADLMRRGLLSRDEFEQHKAKVIDG